jgi:hypothetical protein
MGGGMKIEIINGPWRVEKIALTPEMYQSKEEPYKLHVGDVIRVDGVEQLVGHVNQLGGVCDCCSVTGKEVEVRTFFRVVPEEE